MRYELEYRWNSSIFMWLVTVKILRIIQSMALTAGIYISTGGITTTQAVKLHHLHTLLKVYRRSGLVMTSPLVRRLQGCKMCHSLLLVPFHAVPCFLRTSQLVAYCLKLPHPVLSPHRLSPQRFLPRFFLLFLFPFKFFLFWLLALRRIAL